MKIEIEVFDDGKDPVTCARGIDHTKNPRQYCKYLIGSLTDQPECQIFRIILRKYYTEDEEISGYFGLIEPCPPCIAARKIN